MIAEIFNVPIGLCWEKGRTSLDLGRPSLDFGRATAISRKEGEEGFLGIYRANGAASDLAVDLNSRRQSHSALWIFVSSEVANEVNVCTAILTTTTMGMTLGVISRAQAAIIQADSTSMG